MRLFGSLSATTYYSGGTPLEAIFAPIGVTGGTGGGSGAFVGNGINTFTAGTSSNQTINITSATLANLSVSGINFSNQLSATTLSGGTIFSGSTDLSTIISRQIGGVTATTLNSWTSSGATYYADFVHGLNTNDYTVSTYLTSTGLEIIAGDLQRLNTNTLRVFVSDNTLSVRVILLSKGGILTGGTGNVSGPGVATDSNVALFNGTSGQLIKNSTVKIDGSGNAGFGAISATTIFSGSTNLYSIFAQAGTTSLPSNYFFSAGTISSADTISKAISKLDGNINNINKEVGIIYEESFSSGTISNNYTKIGSNATFIQSGNTIIVNNGINTLTEYIRLNDYYIASDCYLIEMEFIVGDINTKGIRFGIDNYTSPFVIGLDTSISSASTIYLLFGGQLKQTISSSNTSISVNSSDLIRIQVQQLHDYLTVNIFNLTNNTSIELKYQLTTEDYTYSAGRFTLFSIEGFHILTKFKFTDKNIYNPDYVVLGDSICIGRIAYNFEYTWFGQLLKSGVKAVRLAGSARTANDFNIQAFINYLNKINPKEIVCALGTNDITLGLATAISNYNGLISTIKNAGYNTVKHLTLLDRDIYSNDITSFNSSQLITYSADTIINTNTIIGSAITTNNNYSNDLLHLSVDGQANVAEYVKKYLKSDNNVINYVNRNVSIDIVSTDSARSNGLLSTTDNILLTTGVPNMRNAGYVLLYNSILGTSEIVSYQNKNSNTLIGLKRGQFGTSPISSSSINDIYVHGLMNVKQTRNNSAGIYYAEYITSTNRAGFLWGTTRPFSTSDQYTWMTEGNKGFRFTSESDVVMSIMKNTATNTSTLQFSNFAAPGSIGNRWLFVHDSSDNFNFGRGNVAANIIYNVNYNTQNVTFGSVSGVYRLTNGGTDISSRYMFDTDRSLTSGKGYALDTINGFVFTDANGTRRIASSAIKTTNTILSAGTESADLGIYTQSSGTGLSLRMTIGATATTLTNNLVIGTVGNGILVKSGTNARIGSVILTGGTATILNTGFTTNTKVKMDLAVFGGTIGSAYIYSGVPGSSFTINSITSTGTVQATDTSTIDWYLIEQI